MFELVPITLRQAKAFVNEHHRHHIATVGWKFGVGLKQAGELVGVIVAGRPVARGLDDGVTIEVTRCCLATVTKNAASRLYGAVKRAAKALGYQRVITYTLASETGHSVAASGFTKTHEVKGRSWDTPSRRRVDKHPTVDKVMWAVEL